MRNINLVKNIAYAIAFILVGGFIFWLVTTTPGAKPIKQQLQDNVVECKKEASSARLYVDSKVRLITEELKATQQQMNGVKIVDTENITKISDLETSLGLLQIAVESLQKELSSGTDAEVLKKVAELDVQFASFTVKCGEMFKKSGELFAYLIIKNDQLEKRVTALEEQLKHTSPVQTPVKEHSVIVKRYKPRFCR